MGACMGACMGAGTCMGARRRYGDWRSARGSVLEALLRRAEPPVGERTALTTRATARPPPPILVPGAGDGDDVASLLTTTWRTMRRGVLKRNGVPEFHFRQYLFAAQVRAGAAWGTGERWRCWFGAGSQPKGYLSSSSLSH